MTTTRERMERRAERRESWAGARKAKAAASFAASDLSEERSGIPFGQPILAGHHSARRHRRAIDRAHAAGSRGLEHASKAEQHEQAASTLRRQLATSIFSDDDDAIEALRAKVAKLEAERDGIKAINARCRKGDPDAIELVRKACRFDHHDPRRGFPAYKLTNLGATIRQAKQRIVDVERRNATLAAAAATPAGVTITGTAEWCAVTFEERPDRSILDALRAAGFRWRAPSWHGRRALVPADVIALIEGDASG